MRANGKSIVLIIVPINDSESTNSQINRQPTFLILIFIQFKNTTPQSFMATSAKFLQQVVSKHQNVPQIAPDFQVQNWVLNILAIMFPSSKTQQIQTLDRAQEIVEQLRDELVRVLRTFPQNAIKDHSLEQIAKTFFEALPKIYEILTEDMSVILKKDPKARSELQIIKSNPGFYALACHRLAHQLYKEKVPLLPCIISQIAQAKSGVDIHPGAQIGSNCHIDHGSRIVIEETSVIGNNVRIYQGVTLGALSHSKDYDQKKSHPTIEDDVVIYAGATILGGETVIGHHSAIGGNVWLTDSVPPYSKIFHQPKVEIKTTIIPDVVPSSVQQLIGNTPMVEIKNIFQHPHVKILAKLEGQNPGGSVKDRSALYMMQQAQKRGQIKPGMKMIEPSSGNTGIALAMIARMFGVELELVMPENATAQRVQTMKAYGAKVILTPAKGGIEGSRDYAEQKAAQGTHVCLNQFANNDSYLAHYASTGPEVYRDTKGTVTHFVSAMGTTGTIMGTSYYLKEQNPEIKIVGVQPKDGSKIPGIKRWAPKYVPKFYDPERVDAIYDVDEEESLDMMKRLAKQEAIFAGMSSGGAMAAAVKLAKTIQQGTIVVIICDKGDRYLSSGIFEKQHVKQ